MRPRTYTSLDDLQQLFRERITARDIASPLISFDLTHDPQRVLAFMRDNQFDIVGIREDGEVTGWCEREALEQNPGRIELQSIPDRRVVKMQAPLDQVVLKVHKEKFVFVDALGSVQAVVTLADLHKPAVRLWMFGLIGLAEMQLARVIATALPGSQWEAYVSGGRLQRAMQVFQERNAVNQDTSLAECIGWEDRVRIAGKALLLQPLLAGESKSQFESSAATIRDIRNALAHAGELTGSQFDALPGAVEWLERLITNCESWSLADRGQMGE